MRLKVILGDYLPTIMSLNVLRKLLIMEEKTIMLTNAERETVEGVLVCGEPVGEKPSVIISVNRRPSPEYPLNIDIFMLTG